MDLKSLFSKGSLFIQGPLKGPILYAMRSGSQLCQKKEPRRCWLRTESRRTATANVTSKEGTRGGKQRAYIFQDNFLLCLDLKNSLAEPKNLTIEPVYLICKEILNINVNLVSLVWT